VARAAVVSRRDDYEEHGPTIPTPPPPRERLHRPVNLVEERPVPLANNRKKLLQPSCCLKRPLLNDESHE